MELIEEEVKRTRGRQRRAKGFDETEDVEREQAPRPMPRRVAREAEWNSTCTVGLLLITVIIGTLLNSPVLVMHDDEASGIAEPLARILAKSSLNKRLGKYVVNSSDYFALIYATGLYMGRVMQEGKAHVKQTSEQSGSTTSEPTNQAGSGIDDNIPTNVIRVNPRKRD